MDEELKYKSATTYLLSALVPYTEANLKLSFVPKMFFEDLATISRYREKTLRNAMWQAQQRGYIERDNNVIKLTEKGRQRLEPFNAKLLGTGARLMVIFDVPESKASARKQLRTSLRAWHFEQVQRSVWISKYDHRDSLKKLTVQLNIKDNVKIFECLEI